MTIVDNKGKHECKEGVSIISTFMLTQTITHS